MIITDEGGDIFVDLLAVKTEDKVLLEFRSVAQALRGIEPVRCRVFESQ